MFTTCISKRYNATVSFSWRFNGYFRHDKYVDKLCLIRLFIKETWNKPLYFKSRSNKMIFCQYMSYYVFLILCHPYIYHRVPAAPGKPELSWNFYLTFLSHGISVIFLCFP